MIEITSYYILYFYFKNLLPEGNFVRTFCLSWNLPCLKVSRTSRFTLVRSRLTHIFFTIFFITTKIVVVAFENISRRCLLQLLNSVGDIIIRMEQILEIGSRSNNFTSKKMSICSPVAQLLLLLLICSTKIIQTESLYWSWLLCSTSTGPDTVVITAPVLCMMIDKLEGDYCFMEQNYLTC